MRFKGIACGLLSQKGFANWEIGTAFCKAGIDYGVQGVIKALPTPIGSILRKISKLPSDGQKTKKLGINGHINISKGHQILT